MKVLHISDPQGNKRPFYSRPTDADQGVVQQVLKQRDYWLGRLQRGAGLHRWHQDAVARGARPLILDAGANIGASTVWFSQEFPGAHVVAIEPEASNFELLERNTTGLDVDLRRAALGSTRGSVSVIDPGQGAWGYRTVAAADGAVPRIAAGELVAEKTGQGCLPFIAKIDIEGGEADLFAQDTGWVDAFPLLIIELHDWLLPGAGTALPFLRCIASRNRDFVHLGENVFSIRND